MSLNKRLFVVIATIAVVNLFIYKLVYSMKPPSSSKAAVQSLSPKPEITIAERELIEKVVGQALGCLTEKFDEIQANASKSVFRANEALALAHSSNQTSIDAFKLAKSCADIAKATTSELEKGQALLASLVQQIPAASAILEQEYKRVSKALDEQIVMAQEKILDLARKEKTLDAEVKTKIAIEKIKAKDALGINEKQAKIRAQGVVDAGVGAAKENWRNFREIVSDSKLMIKIAVLIVITVLLIYAIKYGLPAIIDYFRRPRVIFETSNVGWFGWGKPNQDIDFNDLIFTPSMQSHLAGLVLRVQSARANNEALPNVLVYGASGTGKTAFSKALAYASGLDYALTSGSEFAKIENLNDANNELRRLLNWAKKSNGLIVFIDEAESLFANRKLSTTKKLAQDFINTFLSLISDQSQKNVMFIFATNHPFKLDDAITDRVGIKVEFTLPEAPERQQILAMYLQKFAQENEEMVVDLSYEVMQTLPKYADQLEGFSPRAIKFIAETMIVNARSQKSRQLTNDIAQSVIRDSTDGLQQAVLWKEELDKWAGVAA
ncbi:MAG: hypothetical protein US49_C0005G0076 [candidate division TM6 bacterium GW2011_GWF2_37_49]|nr:MAG: hypothetical protein US49_C0005G0076 [candidate division TM6 bacterium GW2011_GWF2_37_49]